MKMVTRSLVAGLVCAATVDGATAQTGDNPYTISDTRVVSYESRSVGAVYELHIALPTDADPSAGLPLVVLLDSNEDFPLVTAISRRPRGAGALPDFILVGIGYPEFPMYFRSRDYTPSPGDRPDRPSGGAQSFLHFLSSELVPWVEAEYQTSDTRVLLGHSLGGLLGIASINQAPSLFTAVVASSPAVWWGSEEVLDDFQANGTRLFTSLGSKETELMTRSWHRFADLLCSNAPSETFTAEVFPGEDHSSVKPMAFSRGLRWVFGTFHEAGPEPGESDVEKGCL